MPSTRFEAAIVLGALLAASLVARSTTASPREPETCATPRSAIQTGSVSAPGVLSPTWESDAILIDVANGLALSVEKMDAWKARSGPAPVLECDSDHAGQDCIVRKAVQNGAYELRWPAHSAEAELWRSGHLLRRLPAPTAGPFARVTFSATGRHLVWTVRGSLVLEDVATGRRRSFEGASGLTPDDRFVLFAPDAADPLFGRDFVCVPLSELPSGLTRDHAPKQLAGKLTLGTVRDGQADPASLGLAVGCHGRLYAVDDGRSLTILRARDGHVLIELADAGPGRPSFSPSGQLLALTHSKRTADGFQTVTSVFRLTP